MSDLKRRFAKNATAMDVVKDLDLMGRTFGVTGTTNGIGKCLLHLFSKFFRH
jgi:hypothetical protein